MPDHSLSKEIFPNIQSEPRLTQLEAILLEGFFLGLGLQTEPDLGAPSVRGENQ